MPFWLGCSLLGVSPRFISSSWDVHWTSLNERETIPDRQAEAAPLGCYNLYSHRVTYTHKRERWLPIGRRHWMETRIDPESAYDYICGLHPSIKGKIVVQ